MVVLGNHLGTVARLIVRVIRIIGVNHSHVKSHLPCIICGDEHLRLLLSVRQWRTTQYCGITAFGKLH